MCVCDTMKELNKTKQNKNKKETTEAHERFQTAKQCIRNTKVLCLLHFQPIHDVLETTDIVKALTAVTYGGLFLLVNLFTSEILTNAGAKPRKSRWLLFYN